MRFLLDMGLPPRVTQWLRDQGHQAEHIREIDRCSLDADILTMALERGAVILTSDKDFGDLIAQANLHRPSVILFRLTPAPTEVIVQRLKPVLDEYQELLKEGCLVTIAIGKPRFRKLPIRP